MACSSSTLTELDDHLVPCTELLFGEYVFKLRIITRPFTDKGDQKGPSRKKKKLFQEDTLYKIITALANTSGGVIHLDSADGENLSHEDIEHWFNKVRDHLINVFSQKDCIEVSMHDDGDTSKCVSVLVKKSETFITINSHMYKRGVMDSTELHSYDDLVKIIGQQEIQNEPESPITLACTIRFGQQCQAVERHDLEFKCYKTSSLKELIGRLKEERNFKSFFAMANKPGGGFVIIGVKTDRTTGINTVFGQELEEAQEEQFVTKMAKLLSTDTIWGSETPTHGDHWRCKFIPLEPPPYTCKPPCDHCPHQKRRVLIEVYIRYCIGGVFAHQPESFVVGSSGSIVQISFDDWKRRHRQSQLTSSNSTARRQSTGHFKRLDSSEACSGSGTVSPAALPETEEMVESSAVPSTRFAVGTSVSFVKHSSHGREASIGGETPASERIKHPEKSDLFNTDTPVRYTPARQKIEEALGDKKYILSDIDQEMLGEEAFGIAAMTLHSCIGDTQSSESVVQNDPHGTETHQRKRPLYHKMDLLVVNKITSIFLFVLCSTFGCEDTKRSQIAYAMELGRRIKREILLAAEQLKLSNIYKAVFIRCSILTLDGQKYTSPDYYIKWLPVQTNDFYFADLCRSLVHILYDLPSHVSNVIHQSLSIELSKEQSDVLLGVEESRYNFIEGPPGCGKTLLAQNVCENKGKDRSVYISASEALISLAVWKGIINAVHANSMSQVLQLLRKKLARKQTHIVIDDAHIFSCDENTCKEIFDFIWRTGRTLYVFQDSKYQNFQAKCGQLALDEFHFRYRDVYGPYLHKSLSVVRRNSQTVGNYVMALVPDVVQSSLSSETNLPLLARLISCESVHKGDDVVYKQIENLRARKDNGLLKYILEIVKSGSEFLEDTSRVKPYELTDIAVLLDNQNIELLKSEIEMFRELFKVQFSEGRVHGANKYPREGIVVDSLENFGGLEARFVIFIIPKGTPASMSCESANRTTANPKYKIAIASRAVDRLEFVQEENLDVRHVENLKFDNYSTDALTTNGNENATVLLLWDLEVSRIIRGVGVTLQGNIVYCTLEHGIGFISKQGRPLMVPFTAGDPDTWAHTADVHSETGHIVIAWYRDRHPGYEVSLDIYRWLGSRWSGPEHHVTGTGLMSRAIWLTSNEVIISRWNTAKHTIGRYDIEKKQYVWELVSDCKRLSDLRLSGQGDIFCCDPDGDCIYVYGSQRGQLLGSLSLNDHGQRPNSTDSLFSYPVSVCIAGPGKILVLHREKSHPDCKVSQSVTLWSHNRQSITYIKHILKDLRDMSYLPQIRLDSKKRLIVSCDKTVQAYSVLGCL